MKNDILLAEKKGLVRIYRVCDHCVQVNLIAKGVSMYFSTESFYDFAETLYQGSSKLMNFYLNNMFDNSNKKEE